MDQPRRPQPLLYTKQCSVTTTIDVIHCTRCHYSLELTESVLKVVYRLYANIIRKLNYSGLGYILGSQDNFQTIMRIDLNKYDKLDIHIFEYMYKYKLYLNIKPCIKWKQKYTCILFKTNFKTFFKNINSYR